MTNGHDTFTSWWESEGRAAMPCDAKMLATLAWIDGRKGRSREEREAYASLNNYLTFSAGDQNQLTVQEVYPDGKWYAVWSKSILDLSWNDDYAHVFANAKMAAMLRYPSATPVAYGDHAMTYKHFLT